MSDLISRAALLAEYDKHHVGAPGGARKLIEEAPAVDAVPVVRCRCCKEFIPCAGEHGICFRHSEMWSKNGFCSVGERKEYGDNESK